MPTKRTRVARFNQDYMTPTHWAWLRDEPYDANLHDWFIYHHLDIDRADHPEPDPPRATPYLECAITGRKLWKLYESELLAEHIADSPGTRPARWWQFSAPDPRRRLGGIGTPCHERLADVESFCLGVPDRWIRPSDIETYESMGMPLGVPALDPANPPVFESEAAYLLRQKLLLPGEKKRLRKEEDFEPVSILDIIELEDDL